MLHQGGCQCGKVRLTAAGAPKLVANCHCKSCRQATCAAFATYADFDRTAVRIEGELRAYESSPGVERLFCGVCGVCGAPIAYLEKAADEINLHIGVFDAPESFRPTEDAHQENRLWP